MKKMLYVCTHNASRSQMAEAFTNRLGRGIVTAVSAGTKPGTAVNPVVVEAMREIGYDMSGHYPKLMTDEMVDSADRIITMGCGVSLDDAEGAVCPVFLVPSEDWALDDPHGQPVEKVRTIRDEIKSRVEALVAEINHGGTEDAETGKFEARNTKLETKIKKNQNAEEQTVSGFHTCRSVSNFALRISDLVFSVSSVPLWSGVRQLGI